MGNTRSILIATSATLAFAPPVHAGTMSRAEAMQLYAAGGFPISADGDHPTNRCGAKAGPRITFVDMNDDGRKEALFIDTGACYKPDGRWYAITTREANGHWRRVLEGEGSLKATGTAFKGWFVLTATGAGKTARLHYDGTAYRPVDARPVADAPASTSPPPTGDAAIFVAAGMKRTGGHWESGCNDGNDPGNSYSPAEISERKDLNGDGQIDAVVTEGGAYCYGNTGTQFWLLAGQPGGKWKLLVSAIGIPDFQKTRSVGGWPDIEVGGPGFCFPVLRWNGQEYRLARHQYDGKPCKPNF